MNQESELHIFRKYLQKKGLRYTPEREQIIKEIFSTHDHFDVDTLYLRMRQKGLQISKASIYRLIPLLIEAGLIEEVFFEDGHMHYEHIYGHEPHCHLRCIGCKRIEEFRDLETRIGLRWKRCYRKNLDIKSQITSLKFKDSALHVKKNNGINRKHIKQIRY